MKNKVISLSKIVNLDRIMYCNISITCITDSTLESQISFPLDISLSYLLVRRCDEWNYLVGLHGGNILSLIKINGRI